MDLERLLFTRANIENVGELLVIIHRCMNEVNYKDYAPHEFKKYLANFIYESVIYAAGETGGAYGCQSGMSSGSSSAHQG